MDLDGQMRTYTAELGAVRSKGLGHLELLIALVIGCLVFTLAVPACNGFVNGAKVARAVGEIAALEVELERFRLRNNDRIPANLAELPVNVPSDPWGRDYQFVNFVAAGPAQSRFRKDGHLNTLNSDYDLYSMGADGDSRGPLSARASRDDIVRANNGAFIGLVDEY